MNQNLTEMIFILDRSGSMESLTEETIGGFNSLIEKQKEEPGEARITTILFDDKYELLHDHTPVQEIQRLTRKEYYARGCTALLDAVGLTIDRVGGRLAETPEEERPGRVVMVITTDGYENASRPVFQVSDSGHDPEADRCIQVEIYVSRSKYGCGERSGFNGHQTVYGGQPILPALQASDPYSALWAVCWM